jgi:hypothetical protein
VPRIKGKPTVKIGNNLVKQELCNILDNWVGTKVDENEIIGLKIIGLKIIGLGLCFKR